MSVYLGGVRCDVLKFTLACLILWVGQGCDGQPAKEGKSLTFHVKEDVDIEAISVFRGGQDKQVIIQNAKSGMRPYLHPIMAPDGNGALTEYSPGHHKHQTGLYWGFTRVNGSGAPADTIKKWFYNRNKPQRIKDQIGRDYFHFNGDSHWKKIGSKIVVPDGPSVSWQTIYHMLDVSGEALLEETMNWSLTENENKIILDLEWKGKALEEVVINEFSYGGMFLRMPWKKDIRGEAVNSSGKKNQEAEGQRRNG